jgi:hypothetical protein
VARRRPELSRAHVAPPREEIKHVSPLLTPCLADDAPVVKLHAISVCCFYCCLFHLVPVARLEPQSSSSNIKLSSGELEDQPSVQIFTFFFLLPKDHQVRRLVCTHGLKALPLHRNTAWPTWNWSTHRSSIDSSCLFAPPFCSARNQIPVLKKRPLC